MVIHLLRSYFCKAYDVVSLINIEVGRSVS
jgi:hypothetical protein